MRRATPKRGQGASERSNLDRHRSEEPQPRPEKRETARARPKGNQTKPTRRKGEQENKYMNDLEKIEVIQTYWSTLVTPDAFGAF